MDRENVEEGTLYCRVPVHSEKHGLGTKHSKRQTVSSNGVGLS